MPYDERGGYFVGLVGESNYQAAIRRTKAGEDAFAYLEPKNKHDPHAIVVTNAAGAIIGYIPCANWLQGLVHDQERGFSARVEKMNRTNGILGVVLHVQLDADELPIWSGPAPKRDAAPRQRKPTKTQQKMLTYVMGAGLFGVLYLIGQCSPAAAQQDIRMIDVERMAAAAKRRDDVAAGKALRMTPIEAVKPSQIEGQLYRGNDDAAFRAGARDGCPPDAFAFCEEMAAISKTALSKQWDDAHDPMIRKGIVVAVDRATTGAAIDWSKAQGLFSTWLDDFKDPGYWENARLAAAELKNAPTPRSRLSESNCALDTWTEVHAGMRRVRSRLYCW